MIRKASELKTKNICKLYFDKNSKTIVSEIKESVSDGRKEMDRR